MESWPVPVACRTPRQFLEILAVPGTNRAPHLVITETAAGEPYTGWLEDGAGVPIARLDRFRFAFVDFAPITRAERAQAQRGPVEALRPREETILPPDPRVAWSRPPDIVAGHLYGYAGDRRECAVSLQTGAAAVDLVFHAHAWSGMAEIALNGRPHGVVDLFNGHGPVPRVVTVTNPGAGLMTVSARALDRKAPESLHTQVLLEKIISYAAGDMITPPPRIKADLNRAGRFAARFHAIMADLPHDAVVLDIGGGRRQCADPRYINLEYAALTEPDLLGDGTALPFRDATVDFVYTSGVLEHVRDPLRMGAEIRRVLKPGGRVVASAAFFQPVHNEGQHFFNMTPHGIELVFEGMTKVSTWWSNDFGGMLETLVRTLRLRRVAAPGRIDAFLELGHELAGLIDYDNGAQCATGVWFEGVRDV